MCGCLCACVCMHVKVSAPYSSAYISPDLGEGMGGAGYGRSHAYMSFSAPQFSGVWVSGVFPWPLACFGEMFTL